MGDRVWVIVAHPDDELLGVGGTILRHKQAGDDVQVHILCCGGLRDAERRIADAIDVASDVGVFGYIHFAPQLATTVEAPGIDADIVYTHHPSDLNVAHRAVSEAVSVACRPYTSRVRSLRYLETPSSTEWGAGDFRPSLFVDIATQLDAKIALLRHYASELRPWPHPRSERALTDRAHYWGSIAGLEAAEPFVIGRETW